jgi:hypothetical protein
MLLEVGTRGTNSGGRKQLRVMVDTRNRDSAGGEFGGDVTRAAAEIKNLLAARDGTQREGPGPVAPGKLAVVLFD